MQREHPGAALDVVGVLTSADVFLLPMVGNCRFKPREPLLSRLHLRACGMQCVGVDPRRIDMEAERA